MKKRPIIICIAILILVFIAAVVIINIRIAEDRSIDYDYKSDVQSVSSYDKVLKVAGGSDFSPFSYIDEEGQPCGHDVELVFAIGRELGYRVEITLGDWTEMQEGTLNGTYDVLMTVDYSDERSKIMGYTSPICLDSYVYFGKDSNTELSSIQDFQKLKIAALNGGGSTDNYLTPVGLVGNTTFYNTQIEAFESVVNGENDIAIAGYIYGSNIISKSGMDLKQVGSPLYGSAYYFTYDINNIELGLQLNAALASLEANGELSRIEEKWTTHYQPNLTFIEYIERNIKNVLIGLLIFLIIAIVVAELLYGKVIRREKNLLAKDQLTNLNNMRSFVSQMRTIIQKNNNIDYAIARFDIDNFKSFNRTQGTEAGDNLLRNIGREIQIGKKASNEILLSGYLGADHFVLLLKKGKYTENPENLYKYLMNIAENAVPGYYVSIRMGLCWVDNSDGDLERYCDRSLLAIRSVKNDYYRYWTWFNQNIQQRIDEEKEIADKMFNALDAGLFIPYFQPQIDYSTGEICGAEVLERWIDEDGTLILPSEFVPVFEKNGFVYEMDKAIWCRACECIKKWKEEGIMLPHVSVNISRADIYHSDMLEVIQKVMSDNGITMQEIHFEITESAYIENRTLLIDTVKKLKNMGAYVEMDDFGNGYSTLSSLKDIDVDTIKIDMDLIRDNRLEGKDAAILSAVVEMGINMGVDVIAEGVEKKEQADYLYSLGCRHMQGYLFSKPLNQEAFEQFIRDGRKK